MLEAIKTIIAKIKTRMMLNRCYDTMEDRGIAVFGMCEGKYHNDEHLYKECSICPYFTDIRK